MNVPHGGFRALVLVQFGNLLSRPLGRGLVIDLMNRTQPVTIMPTFARRGIVANRGAGFEETSPGREGPGGTTTIMMDADLRDDSIVVLDAAGHEIEEPLDILLGHELIHAQHNAAGQNRSSQAPIEAEYENREEEETISTGPLTENMLRGEHGVAGTRVGHGGRDTRTR